MKLAWSKLARQKIQQLWRFSLHRWGRDVAQHYLEDIRTAAKHVNLQPERARLLRTPYRIVAVRSHYLLVRIDLLSDLLNTAMDIKRHLPPED